MNARARRRGAPFLLVGLLPLRAPAQESAPAVPGRTVLDGVAAIVNDEVITTGELEKALAPARAAFGFEDPKRWAAYRAAKLRELVEERLLVQAARRRQVSATAIEDRARDEVEAVIRERGSRANYIEWLGRQGKSEDDFLSERRSEEYAMAFLRQELGFETGPSGRASAEVHVRPGAMREYYRTHAEEFTVESGARCRMILLHASNERWAAPDAARAKAAEVRDRIAAGEDFAALAREVSDWKPDAGGDMGWVDARSPYDRSIVSFALAGSAGAVSPVLVLDGGFAVVKVEETRVRRVRPFEDPAVQKEILGRLAQEKQQEYLKQVRSRLLREAYIWPPDLLYGR